MENLILDAGGKRLNYIKPPTYTMNIHFGEKNCGPNEITKAIAAAERVLLFKVARVNNDGIKVDHVAYKVYV